MGVGASGGGAPVLSPTVNEDTLRKLIGDNEPGMILVGVVVAVGEPIERKAKATGNTFAVRETKLTDGVSTYSLRELRDSAAHFTDRYAFLDALRVRVSSAHRAERSSDIEVQGEVERI